MEQNDLFLDAISSLTGGLVTDLTTVMIAMVAISFICLGLALLRNVLFDSRDRYVEQARREKSIVNDSNVDPVLRDVASIRYKKAIRRASE